MTAATREITIAILPFQLLNERETLHPILHAFAEDLSITLSKFIGLSVISHYSTTHIRDISDREMIRDLGAQYLVTGSFRLQGAAIRIGVHLIRTSNFTVVFSDQHEEQLESIPETQDRIVQQVVSVLQQQVDYDLLSFSFRKEKVQLAAYEQWLVGKELLKKGSVESDAEAREHFFSALEIDPGFARAYTGLSLSYFNEWSCQLWDRWDVSRKGARENALKALEIDDSDYLSLAVLGRTYLFSEEYDKAEHYLRKALRMNPNDADNLILIAFSFMYLGYAEEAVRLYQKACFLNPMRQDTYFAYGSNMYVELGDYDRALKLGKTVNGSSVWVDFNLYLAAASYYQGNLDDMERYWGLYLAAFQKCINKGQPATDREALQWHLDVNPYRGTTRLADFRDFIRSGRQVDRLPQPPLAGSVTTATFLQKDDFWQLTFGAATALLKDAKGLQDLARLLAEPEREWHCTELMGAVLVEAHDTETMDGKAIRQYRNRLNELRAEIEEAEEMNDLSRIGGLQSEFDQLVSHLSGSLNVRGRAREVGAAAEKARSAVTWRIRSAIKKIEAQHPVLGRHLANAVKTGNFCSYQPAERINWTVIV